jgi:hypothetical protein
MLQAYMGGKQLRDIEKQKGELSERSTAEAQDFLRSMAPGAQQRMSPDAALAASLSTAPTEAQPITSQQRQEAIMGAGLSANPQMRMAAQLAAMKPERKVKFGDVDTSKYTPESLKAADSADDLGLLVPVAGKPEKLPSAIEGYNFAVDQGFKGTFIDYQKEMARAGANNVITSYGAPVSGVDPEGNPVFFQPSKDGGKAAIIPGVRPEAKPLNESQANAAGFANRLEMANDVLSSTLFKPTIGNQLGAAIPYSNAFLSNEQQKVEQAKREFINAQLRRESGAAIGSSEFDNANLQYFPQPGDKPDVLEQKARSRALAIKNMRGAAGPSSKAAMPSWLPNAQSAVDKYAPKGGQ